MSMTTNQRLVNKKFEELDDSFMDFVLNTRELDENQCYFVIAFGEDARFFLCKEQLRNYLESLDSTYTYDKLSSLVKHLVKKNIIVEASITHIKNYV